MYKELWFENQKRMIYHSWDLWEGKEVASCLPSDKLFLCCRESQTHINSGGLRHGGWQITKCLWQEDVGAVTYSILSGQTAISLKLQYKSGFFTTHTFSIPFVASQQAVVVGRVLYILIPVQGHATENLHIKVVNLFLFPCSSFHHCTICV